MLKIDPFRLSIAIAVALGCLSLPVSAGANQQHESEFDSIQWNETALTNADSLTESGIQPDALQIYDRAVHELHQGHAVLAEADANRALQQDAKFADAAALAATAALMQQQFAARSRLKQLKPSTSIPPTKKPTSSWPPRKIISATIPPQPMRSAMCARRSNKPGRSPISGRGPKPVCSICRNVWSG